MTKFEIFKERILIALNFFDVFNEGFEPLKTSNEISSCHLLLTKTDKKFPQRLPTKLQKIKNFYISESKDEKGFVHIKKRKNKFAFKFFNEYLNRKNSSEKSILTYFFKIIQDYHSVKKFKFMDSMFLDDFESELEYFTVEEENFNYYLEKFLSIEDNNSEYDDDNETICFLISYFEEIFLHNFFVSICYLAMNFVFFMNCFNDQILKKYMSGGKDESGISLTNLISCQEFAAIKDCAKEVIQNSGEFYSRDLFNKYNQNLLITLSDIGYLDVKAKKLLYCNNNLGYEKVNFILALTINNQIFEDMEEGMFAALTKKMEEIANAAFDFIDFDIKNISENLVFVFFETLLYAYNFSPYECSAKYIKLLNFVAKTLLTRFELAVNDCRRMLIRMSNQRLSIKEISDIRELITKKIKIYLIVLQQSDFLEHFEKSLDIVETILKLLYKRNNNLPYWKEVNELF